MQFEAQLAAQGHRLATRARRRRSWSNRAWASMPTHARSAAPTRSGSSRSTSRRTPPAAAGNPTAEVQLWLAEDGRIERHALLKSSGNPAWDRAVLRAVERAGRLPADHDGRVPRQIVVAFRPKA